MLFLLWSRLSTCLESESKSVRSKKFGKNFKFPSVKFWKRNSNIWKNCQRGFFWIVTTDLVSPPPFLILLFNSSRVALRKEKRPHALSLFKAARSYCSREVKKWWGERGLIFFSRYRPPSSDRARVIFPLAYFIIATSLLVVSLEQSKCPLRMKGWIVKQSAFKCELPSCRLNSFINLWSFYT